MASEKEFKVEMKEIPKDDYIALLESNYEAQIKIKDLERTLRAEYNFAEEKIKKVEELETELKAIEVFIESDNAIKCKYRNYKAAMRNIHEVKPEPADTPTDEIVPVDDEGNLIGGYDDHE